MPDDVSETQEVPTLLSARRSLEAQLAAIAVQESAADISIVEQMVSKFADPAVVDLIAWVASAGPKISNPTRQTSIGQISTGLNAFRDAANHMLREVTPPA